MGVNLFFSNTKALFDKDCKYAGNQSLFLTFDVGNRSITSSLKKTTSSTVNWSNDILLLQISETIWMDPEALLTVVMFKDLRPASPIVSASVFAMRIIILWY